MSIISDSLSSEFSIQQSIVELLLRKKVKKTGILGILPRENTSEYILNQGVLLHNLLKQNGIEVKINDPYSEKRFIEDSLGCQRFSFPNDLKDMDSIILMTPHSYYKMYDKINLLSYIKKNLLIVDITGEWERYSFNLSVDKVDYRCLGRAKALE